MGKKNGNGTGDGAAFEGNGFMYLREAALCLYPQWVQGAGYPSPPAIGGGAGLSVLSDGLGAGKKD